MKKITLLLVIIFTFLFSTTSWGEWIYVTESVEGDKLYYDKDRVRKNGKYLYFWELTDYLKPTEGGDFSVTAYTELDCSIFRFKTLTFQSYDKSMGKGEMKINFTPKDEWGYPPPNSMVEVMFNKICEEFQ